MFPCTNSVFSSGSGGRKNRFVLFRAYYHHPTCISKIFVKYVFFIFFLYLLIKSKINSKFLENLLSFQVEIYICYLNKQDIYKKKKRYFFFIVVSTYIIKNYYYSYKRNKKVWVFSSWFSVHFLTFYSSCR